MHAVSNPFPALLAWRAHDVPPHTVLPDKLAVWHYIIGSHPVNVFFFFFFGLSAILIGQGGLAVPGHLDPCNKVLPTLTYL
jgi:hypothetical protein